MEITDREDLGANLYAPQTDQSGGATWSYSLVSHVQAGDVVFHYWNQVGQDKAIVGYSQATGALEESQITWQAHGSYGQANESTALLPRPAWIFPLTGFTDLAVPVTLDDLRSLETDLRAGEEAVKSVHSGALYLPFAFSDQRPLRTAQGYLTKMPAEFVATIPGLREALSIPIPTQAGDLIGQRRRGRSSNGTGYLSDTELRHALERHAVDWTLDHFDQLGYLVDDVGATNPFDILAVGETDELHIEVKGSSGTSTTVELTAGEVRQASGSEDYQSVLVVVDEIAWERDPQGIVVTSGGRSRIWHDWRPTDERLDPTQFRYLLPPLDPATPA
jgi:hypothetical protein